MINNRIYKPTSQLGRRQEGVLQDIAILLRRRGQDRRKTTIGKIKAHTVCTGSELADHYAKAVALGTHYIDYTCPSNKYPMYNLIWPAEEKQQDDGNTTYQYATNLNQ